MAKTFGAEDILAALGITTDKFEVVDSDNETTRESAVVASNLGAFIPGSEQSFNPAPQPILRAQVAKMAMAESDAVPIASGENSYRITVNVTFEIDQ